MYTEPMPKLTQIRLYGDQPVLVVDDGRKVYGYPAGPNRWLVRGLDVTGVDNRPDEPGSGTELGDIPDSLTAQDANGQSYTFNHTQLTRAAQTFTAAKKIAGFSKDVVIIMFITEIVESVFRIYSNVAHYPETSAYEHDADGSDSDSVGLFQQRPVSGWGTPQQCMDPDYSTRAFLGGSTGPNGGSPRGLFDVSGWQSMSKGEAAQAVQGSAFPERYQVVVPVAEAVYDALVRVVNQSEWRWPFQYSKFVLSTPLAQYGMRVNPVSGRYILHAGLDFGAGGIAGMNIPCACAGTVSEASFDSARGNHVSVKHAGGFETHYFHMRETPSVHVGDTVTQGQKLGVVGTTGNSTGPHLHWETLDNGHTQNPRDFMKARGVPES